MMWMWMSAIVVLFGAELNSEIERQAAINAPLSTPRPQVAAAFPSPGDPGRAVPAVPKEH
jgi:membrane protein